jgi:hypothetical protein
MHPELKDHAESVRGEEMRAAMARERELFARSSAPPSWQKRAKPSGDFWMRLPRYPNWMTSLDK